jgi:type II secretory pathway pseudopilin PulG
MKRPGAGERGVALIALMVAVAITLIGMTVMMPTWGYVMKDEREEELLFRGTQIAEAIAAYQKGNGGAAPVTLEQLVKARPRRYLRKLYKDPMTPLLKGEWHLVRAGEPCPPLKSQQAGSGQTGGGLQSIVVPPASATGTTFGGIVGVRSRSTEKSLRIVNNASQYSEWCFLASKKPVVVIGKQPNPMGSPGQMPGLGTH